MKAIRILRSAENTDISNSKNVRVKDVKKNRRARLRTNSGKIKIIRGGLKTITHTQPSSKERQGSGRLKPRKHTQYVYPVDPKSRGKLNDVDVKVSCSCERFLYYYEVALNERGAADIIHSNGEPPYDTNPGLKIGCCKHLVQVLKLIVSSRY